MELAALEAHVVECGACVEEARGAAGARGALAGVADCAVARRGQVQLLEGQARRAADAAAKVGLCAFVRACGMMWCGGVGWGGERR